MFSSVSAPFSIRLFLAEGSATGLTVATIPNWAGSILRCRNASLPSLLGRAEAQRPGVYVLQGPDPNLSGDQGGVAVYIGQGGRIADRLPQSAGERAFWEIAAIVTTSDPNFSAAHFLALEAMMIREARVAGRVRLDNGTSPSDTAYGILRFDLCSKVVATVKPAAMLSNCPHPARMVLGPGGL